MVMVGTDLHAEFEDLVGWHRRNRATSVEQFTVRKGLCAGHRFEEFQGLSQCHVALGLSGEHPRFGVDGPK